MTDSTAHDSAYWMAEESEYYVHTFNRQPIVIERGEGARVWDVDGNEYLDFTAGLAVTCLGHSHPAVTEAVREQAGTIMQMSNLYYTVPQLELARMLVENSCMDKVFFANSGVEANEGAVNSPASTAGSTATARRASSPSSTPSTAGRSP